MKQPLYITIGVVMMTAGLLSGCGGGSSSSDGMSAAPPSGSTPPVVAKADLTAVVTEQMTAMPQSMEPAESVEPMSLDAMDFSADEAADAGELPDDETPTAFNAILAAE